jgi:hypothetical protein
MKFFDYIVGYCRYYWWKVRHPFQQLPSLMCIDCFTDLNKEPGHRCGDEPDVSIDDNLTMVIGWQGAPHCPTPYACAFCGSFVGKQHARNCPTIKKQ